MRRAPSTPIVTTIRSPASGVAYGVLGHFLILRWEGSRSCVKSLQNRPCVGRCVAHPDHVQDLFLDERRATCRYTGLKLQDTTHLSASTSAVATRSPAASRFSSPRVSSVYDRGFSDLDKDFTYQSRSCKGFINAHRRKKGLITGTGAKFDVK